MRASLACPACHSGQIEEISDTACVVAYDCPGCGATLAPSPGDGCVFCSYGNVGCCGTAVNPVRDLPARTQRAQVVLGISPFNSYYSERHLANLFAWSATHFEHAAAFVPDTPTTWTLEAGGYRPADAAYKTARQVRYLRNKIGRAQATVRSPVSVLAWSAVSLMQQFPILHARCAEAFTHDSHFRVACLSATDEVLENRRRADHMLNESDRLRAVDYLIAELPLILFGPTLFSVSTSTFVYHRSLALFEDLFAGHFGLAPESGQHFVVAHELDHAA